MRWAVGGLSAQLTVVAKPQPVYQVDRAMSKRRAKKLQSYLTKKVWGPTTRRTWPNFICESKEDCKASAKRRGAKFYEAQGYAVGSCFDLSTENGDPYRVLVVPMEGGGGGRYASVEQSTASVGASGRLLFTQRNAHMRGVALALRLALGLPYADVHGQPFSDPREEQVNFINGTSAHLFECYAMANLLLCSAVAQEKSQAGRGTAVMRANCVRHLIKAIDILQPTLVISQGWGLVPTLKANFGVKRTIDLRLPGDCILADCNLDDNPFVWVGLWHPTRFWSTINQTYFRETVDPAINAARKRALKLAQTV
jgi:hypothetical protein